MNPNVHTGDATGDSSGDVKGDSTNVPSDPSCLKTYTGIKATLSKSTAAIEAAYKAKVSAAEKQYKVDISSGVTKDQALYVLKSNLFEAYLDRKNAFENSLDDIDKSNSNGFESCLFSQNPPLSDKKITSVCKSVLGDVLTYVLKVNGSNKKAFALTHPTKTEIEESNTNDASERKQLNEIKQSIPSICQLVVSNKSQ